MARKMTEWPSKRGPITKIMPSDGCIGDTVPLAVGKWYDFHEFGWYMGNVGLHKDDSRKIRTDRRGIPYVQMQKDGLTSMPAAWREIVAAYRTVKAADDCDLLRAWERFEDLTISTSSDPPYHLRGLVQEIEQYRGERPRSDIAILDHGSAGGMLPFYLAALSYTNVHGVDIEGSRL